MTTLSASAIEEAVGEIDSIFLNTPQFELDALNETLSFGLTLKIETLNPIRSFKGRGTSLLLARVQPQTKLVCASAGNFGQGVAYAGRARGVAVTVFAAENANAFKLERVKALGAQVIQVGADFDAAKDAAREYAKDKKARYVVDSADIETALGAGSIGVELLKLDYALDAVILPVGNGALINGMGTYLKAHGSKTQIIGVVAAAAPAMALSWRAKKSISTPTADTIADGIGIREPVDIALEQSYEVVDDYFEVTDADILDAMKLAHAQVGLVLEPAGAAGLAAASRYRGRFKGKRVATVLCGSNVTQKQLKSWF